MKSRLLPILLIFVLFTLCLFSLSTADQDDIKDQEAMNIGDGEQQDHQSAASAAGHQQQIETEADRKTISSHSRELQSVTDHEQQDTNKEPAGGGDNDGDPDPEPDTPDKHEDAPQPVSVGDEEAPPGQGGADNDVVDPDLGQENHVPSTDDQGEAIPLSKYQEPPVIANGGDNDGDVETKIIEEIEGAGEGDESVIPHGERKDPEEENEISDDEGVKADENSIEKVNNEREELAKKLHVLEVLQERMSLKNKLLTRVRSLQYEVNSSADDTSVVRDEKLKAEENLHLAVARKNATNDERETTAREKEELEKLLDELKSEKKSFEDEYTKLSVDKQKKEEMEKDLKKKRAELTAALELLVRKFRHQGFHRLLEVYMEGMPPIVRETVLKTGNSLDPIHGIEEVSNLTDQLTSTFFPSMKQNQFYLGLIFYIFLLFPMVTALWLMMKIRQRLSLLTVEHYLIAINLYFGVMSSVCAIMTIIGGTDVLAVFRQESKVAEGFMLLHGFLFVVHLVLHGVTAYVSGSRKDFIQYLGMSCIALHFFTHAYKRTILNRDPNVGAPAYVVYAAVFLYVLYDRGVHIIEAAVRGRKAGLSAFGTFPTELENQNGTSAIGGKGHGSRANGVAMSTSAVPAIGIGGVGQKRSDTTVYFAGLPVFNGPSQSSLSDPKTI